MLLINRAFSCLGFTTHYFCAFRDFCETKKGTDFPKPTSFPHKTFTYYENEFTFVLTLKSKTM